jgi:hypothetical protein
MNFAEIEEPMQDEEVEIITADETTEEYAIGDAPPPGESSWKRQHTVGKGFKSDAFCTHSFIRGRRRCDGRRRRQHGCRR